MNFELNTLSLSAASSQKCDALIVLVPEGTKPGKDAVSAILAQALKSGDLELKAGKNLQIYASPLLAARRVILAGSGDGSARSVRQALAGVANVLKSPKVKKAVVVFAGKATSEAVAAAVQCCGDLSYVYTTTKTKAEPLALNRLVIGVEDTSKVKSAFDMACAVAKGVGFAREWANRPANHATPTLLANAAKGLTTTGITCKVHGPAEVAKLGMGAFMAVAQGSSEQLRFIELRYNGAAKAEAPVVLVGKGITFDTGGISLKPAAEMDEMKFDMGGAASVLGVFTAPLVPSQGRALANINRTKNQKVQTSEHLRQPFIVSTQASKASQPSKTALHNPATGQQYKAFFGFGQFDDLKIDALFCGLIPGAFTRVTLIRPSHFDALAGGLLHCCA